jgi:glycosyltransferase involved in cell wall biosynthesis
VTRVDQLLPRLAARDAIGAHALHMQSALRDGGIECDIYAAEWDGELADRVRPFGDYADDPNAWLLYHASIGSRIATRYADVQSRKLLDYHNITPHEHFDVWAPEITGVLVSGRHQLVDLAPFAHGGFADSHFNELELQRAGCTRTAVVPVLVDVRRAASIVDDALVADLARTKRGADWLFVGRVAPNKAQHELVKVFAQYRRSFDAGARLWLVGGDSSAHYRAALDRFVAEAGLQDAVQFVGSVGDAALGAYYEAADVFVCVSEHEGFCVPVLEAMAHGLPVVARATTAVPETVGDAGVLVPPRAPRDAVAIAAARVLSDRPVRDALVAAGRQRVEHFSLARSQARFLEALDPMLASAS